MLPTINLTAGRKFSIKNFEEDKRATLEANRGLRYLGKENNFYTFCGEYYLTNPQGELIESFEITIRVEDKYPNVFPIVFLDDKKIEKSQDNHININDSTICFEHTYITNYLAKSSIRIYDFINYFLPKYFSWILVKTYGDTKDLQEWGHGNAGTIQFYESLLETSNKETIRIFLNNYCKVSKIGRNDKCYCGNGKKIKYCHYDEAIYLKSTSTEQIKKDIDLFLATE